MLPVSHGEMTEFYDNMTKDFVERCTICGECLQACPLFPLTKCANRGPQAIIEKVVQLLKGGEVSEEASEMLVSCTWGCNTCVKACPEGLIPRLAFMLALPKMVSAGKKPLPPVFQTVGNRYGLANVFHALQVKPSEMRWIKKAPAKPEPVDVVFWASCSGTCHPNVLLDVVGVLDRMGISFATLGGGEICCGLSAILRGDLEAMESLGETFVSNIAAFHPKKALFLCHGCQARCSGVMPGFPSPLPFETSWLPDFLVENLGKIPFTQRVDKVVTVHDSCGVTSFGNYEVTRELLRAIPGITLVEMEHNRENNLCCGGLAVHTRPEITEHMRRAPLREADAAGADILATTCIGCHASFLPVEHHYRCEVRSFISLVAEAVGVHNEDRFRKYMRCGSPAEVLAEARDYIDVSDYSLEEMERVLPGMFNRLRGSV